MMALFNLTFIVVVKGINHVKAEFYKKKRSDKFPLTLHPTGQYCKKIKGKLYYFGNDYMKARLLRLG